MVDDAGVVHEDRRERVGDEPRLVFGRQPLEILKQALRLRSLAAAAGQQSLSAGRSAVRADTPASTNSRATCQPRDCAYWRMADSCAGMERSRSACCSVETRA
jgi:hypothetical protein